MILKENFFIIVTSEYTLNISNCNTPLYELNIFVKTQQKETYKQKYFKYICFNKTLFLLRCFIICYKAIWLVMVIE